MTVCYVLAADTWNDHAAMFCISAATLRQHHPDVDVVLVVDDVTLAGLGDRKRLLERYATRLVSARVSGDPRERSRALKTTLRSHLTGPFLFLDLDTLVMRPLHHLFQIVEPLAIALDYEVGTVNNDDKWVYESVSPSVHPQRAFNSGVIVADDSAKTHAFFRQWHATWLKTKELGRVDDQPSLNSVLAGGDYPVKVLSADDNAMVLYFPWRFRRCRIAHFLASTKMFHTLMTDLIVGFREAQEVDVDLIQRAVRNRHPWGRTPEPWQLVRSRNYYLAAATKLRRIAKNAVAR